MTVIEMR